MSRMLQIKQINSLENSGAFKKITFNHQSFSNVNIIFGNNYSGKTSLSRVFNDISSPSLMFDTKYSLRLECTSANRCNACSNGKKQDCENAQEITEFVFSPSPPCDINTLVFNEEYELKHFKIFYTTENSDEGVPPIETVILGEDAVAAYKKIEKYKKEKEQKQQEITIVEGKCATFSNLKESVIKKIINELKKDKSATIKKYYFPGQSIQQKRVIETINSLYTEYGNALSTFPPLSEDEKKEKEAILQENISENYIPPSPLTREYDYISEIDKANALLEYSLARQNKLKTLEENRRLEKWVEEGQELHIDDNFNCKFCDGEISQERWNKIIQHFSSEYKQHSNEIADLINHINQEKNAIDDDEKQILQSDFLERYKVRYKEQRQVFEKYKDDFLKIMNNLIERLEAKAGDIYSPHEVYQIPNGLSQQDYLGFINGYKQLCEDNSDAFENIKTAKKDAQKALQTNFMVEYLLERHTVEGEKYGYKSLLDKEEELKKECDDLNNEISIIEKNIQNEIRKTKTKTEAADKINGYLKTNYMQHFELRLVTTNSEENIEQYQIYYCDENKRAKTLSKGEKTFLSFCYFIVRLEEEVKTSLKENKLFVAYVDDPVSSLDSNHIDRIYSILKVIVDEYKKSKLFQIFISTHSKQFLYELHNFSRKDKNRVKFYQLQNINGRRELTDLPPDFRHFGMEIHELFRYLCRAVISHLDCGDTFEEKSRKFLETYFRFYFGTNDLEKGVERLINKNILYASEVQEVLINRSVNNTNHLNDQNSESIRMLSKDILKMIKNHDENLFNELLSYYCNHNNQNIDEIKKVL